MIGCDISKDKIDLHNLDTGESLIVENNREGYQEAIGWLKTEQLVCMEATGHYYQAFADHLVNNGVETAVINPLKIRYYGKAKLSRTKTDKQDAKLIAQYAQDMQPKERHIVHSDMDKRIKAVIVLIGQLKSDLSAIKNRLEATTEPVAIELLARRQQQTKADLESMQNLLVELTAAKDAVAQEHLASIPGIGNLTASVILHYLSNYRFTSANQLTAFAGLAPQQHQSGSSVHKPDRLSKFGNRTLKGVMYMAALAAIRAGIFKSLTDRLKAKKKAGKVIVVAIMRKLLVIAYHLYSRGQAFDSGRYKTA